MTKMTTPPVHQFYNSTPVRIHWRSLKTDAAGQSAALYPRDEAVRHIAALNATQARFCHWWYVVEGAPAVTVEPETNTELSQIITTEFEAAQAEG